MEIVTRGELEKKFAWWPVKTVSGKYLWFTTVYAQSWSVELGPDYMVGTHYYTPEEAVIKSLSSDQ